jgi:hypothetical protein
VIGRIAGLDRRVAPAIAKGDAAEHGPPRPDRSEMPQHFGQDGGGGNLPRRRETCQMIEQASGPGFIVPRKDGRCAQYGSAKAAQQIDSPRDPNERIVGAGLKAVAERGCREFRELYRVDAQAIAQFRGKQPPAEHRKTGERKAFGAPNTAPRGGVAIVPGRAGAGIEQHADDGKIELRTRTRRNAGPTRSCGNRDPAIIAVDREVTPA